MNPLVVCYSIMLGVSHGIGQFKSRFRQAVENTFKMTLLALPC